jgi:hypothetical protein
LAKRRYICEGSIVDSLKMLKGLNGGRGNIEHPTSNAEHREGGLAAERARIKKSSTRTKGDDEHDWERLDGDVRAWG